MRTAESDVMCNGQQAVSSSILAGVSCCNPRAIHMRESGVSMPAPNRLYSDVTSSWDDFRGLVQALSRGFRIPPISIRVFVFQDRIDMLPCSPTRALPRNRVVPSRFNMALIEVFVQERRKQLDKDEACALKPRRGRMAASLHHSELTRSLF